MPASSPASQPCACCGRVLPPGFSGNTCPACLLLAALPDSVSVTGETHTIPIDSGSFIPPARAGGNAPSQHDLEVIGPYRLLEPLGEGGFGVVYRALQQEPIRREVALKLIKPGMGSREVLARFEAERRAVALMEHPNIAAVLDAGTAENGQPYFVMELVRGQPITAYCDNKRLTLRQRLELFIPVCQAVQHAHQKAVLHRDLKPSNILVAEMDGQPLVKVIDFGVAKALGQDGEESWQSTLARTLDGMVVGTPQYMSPEQAGAAPDLDTRSDVYTLGVILYELLCGETPLTRESIRRAAVDEMLRRIREEEVVRPSSKLTPVSEAVRARAETRQVAPEKMSRELKGDLDWITLRALEKDRERRYGSAAALAADLQRHLDDEPVEAGPPSAWYQFGKFARRNRLALASAASIALLLVAGIAVSTWQAVRAMRAEHYAQQQRDRAEAVLSDLIKTAPTFIEVAMTDMQAGRFTKALEDTRNALRLEPQNASSRLLHANLLQVLMRIDEALVEYHQVKHLTTEAALTVSAEENISLCQELKSLASGSVESDNERKSRLCDALLTQDRMVEAGYLAAQIGRDAKSQEAAIIAALAQFRAQKNWGPERLDIEPTGTFFVDLSGLEVDSVDALMQFPISRLYLNRCRLTRLPDLSKLPLLNLSLAQVRLENIEPLRGIKLRELNLYATHISDLSPLSEAPLEQLNLLETDVVDLSPLRGAPLERIDLPRTVSDIGPLRGAPLKYVRMSSSECVDLSPLSDSPLEFLSTGPNITNLEPLRRCPVRILDLSPSKRIRDYTPLLDCKNLQKITFPEGAEISVLREHPGLISISISNYDGRPEGPLAAKEFWERYDARMQSEEERLRASLAGLRQKNTSPRQEEIENEGLLLHHIADLLRQQTKLDEARELADEAIKFYRLNSGLPGHEIRHAWQVLASVQEAQGEVEAAKESRRMASLPAKPRSMAATGDAEWKKVEAALDAIKNPKQKPNSRDEAIANLKAGLKEFDAAHAAAMKVSTANPVRWSAALFNANVEKSRGGVGAPPVENLTAELEALVKADDASADDKAAAEKALKTIKTMAELKSKPLNLKFTAVDGREVDLEKMRGKVVLIDFWATWCGPCVAELPNVLKAYKELHPKGFEIVGISLDSDKVQLEKFVKDQGMAWPQFFDGKGWKNEISSSYSINSIPTMWLVDQKGMVIDTAARSGLEEKLVKLLK